MQSERTLKFWDDYYEGRNNTQQQDWILQPTTRLLELLENHLSSCSNLTASGHGGGNNAFRILEIGCGTSVMARELWRHLQKKKPRGNIEIWATDVSEVCIEQVRERDADFINNETNGLFQYKVVDLVKDQNQEWEGTFDAVIDKGCLDTFLFRSRQRGSGRQQAHGSLISTALDRVQSFLKQDSGVYVILTPRSKLKSVRDYAGFSSVQRHAIDPADQRDFCRGDLEEKQFNQNQNKRKKDERFFLYVCCKNSNYSYHDQHRQAFVVDRQNVSEDDKCLKCGTSFFDFRQRNGRAGRSEAYCLRQWKGHCLHCKKN